MTTKIIWVAVYDSLNTDYFYWKVIFTLPIKILSFNKKVNEKANRIGIKNEYFKYYPDPEKLAQYALRTDAAKVLFWYRGTVKWEEIKNILNPEEIETFTYRSAPDHGFEAETISEEDVKHYKIRFDNYPFDRNRNIFKEMLAEHSIFIEPRRMEGIGQSYLKALASGHCVIANDDATMNEYIENGVNGIIVNLDKPKKISLKNWRALGQQARESVVWGRKEWLGSKEMLIDFITSDASTAITNPLSVRFWRTVYAIKHLLYVKKQDSVRRSLQKKKMKKLAPPTGKSES